MKNKLEFETHWQGDEQLTWEPLSSFPGKLEHQEIVKFRENFPDKYKIVENCQFGFGRTDFHSKITVMAAKTKRKSHRNWSYVELTEAEEKSLYEKPDSAAPRELKSLYDPNRLKDNQEEVHYIFNIKLATFKNFFAVPESV